MNIPVENCSSCMACANICSHNAIEIIQDSEGFYRPQINEEKCISCGNCERFCPWNNLISNPNGNKKVPKTLASFNKDEIIRSKSSSGGVFSSLANSILNRGGVVVGVGYKDSTHLEFKIVENHNEVEVLRLSKYFQANAGLIYKRVKDILQKDREVLFSGTSCQIAALYSVLGKKNFHNLFTVDIVCHGVPSQKVFEKYVRERETSNDKILTTNFRDKISGWNHFSITNIFSKANGELHKESKRLNEDPFMISFLKNLCLNTSCASCKYCKLPRIADITLGDYWYVSKYHPNMDDNKGISVVLLNNSHGEMLFNFSCNDLTTINSSLESAIAGNPCIVRASYPHKNRNNFFKDLDSSTLEQLLHKYNPPPNILYRIIRKIWRTIKKKS